MNGCCIVHSTVLYIIPPSCICILPCAQVYSHVVLYIREEGTVYKLQYGEYTITSTLQVAAGLASFCLAHKGRGLYYCIVYETSQTSE
jgi:hypothetical protein